MKIFPQYIITFLLSNLIYFSAFSQSNTIKFDHITVNEGLTHSNIHCIFQDSKGFMWFGTADGLNRFDGYNIKTFSSHSEDTNSISGPAIRTIFEDDKHNLWIGTNGLDIYNQETEKITHYTHDPNNEKSISKGEVTCIYKENSESIWIGVEGGGLNKFNPNNKQFIRYIHDNKNEKSISNNNVSVIFQDRFGILWIGTGYGLNKFDFKNKEFIKYLKDPNKTNSIGGNRITSIFEDSDGNLWIGANPGGLNKYNRKKDNFTTFKFNANNPQSISSDRVNAISEDANKNLLIGTSNGFNVFDKTKKSFTRHQTNLYDYYSINNNYITSVFCDNAGIIWIGTYNAGINKYESKMNYFVHYKHVPNNNYTLNNNNITSISEDNDGNIWVGTNGGGLNMLNPSNKTATYYKSNYNNNYSLSFNTVLSMRITKSGNIWIGSNILDKFVPSENPDQPGYFIHFPENQKKNSIKGSVIWTIYEDIDNNLWVGALNYLNKIEFNGNNISNISNYTYNPDDPESIGNGHVEVVYQDSKKTIWVGADGLNKLVYNNDQIKFIRYQHNSENKKSISSNKVKCIYEDSSNRLWIGTEGGGLNKFNIENEEFTHLSIKDGLPNDVIWGILEDNNKKLWLSTNKGLVRFNTDNNSFKVFDFTDGLPGTEFNQNAYYKSKSGKLYFGGKNGMVSFYPDSIKDNQFMPKVVLTDFRILNETVPIDNSNNKDAILNKSISETEIIRIKYSDYLISFSFAALHYANPSKIDYKYKLEPIEKNWNATNSEGRIATYTNLRPGKYNFKVKATNSDKVWNNEATSVQLIVAPPFWLTWWAYIIYAGIVISIFIGLRNFIVMRERYKSELKLEKMEVKKTNELNQLKLRFFTNISHEFRTPLTLILGPLENLLSSKKTDSKLKEDFEVMHRNASRLLRLVNQIMDFRKIESGQLKPELTKADIISFILNIGNSFKNIANLHNINYELHTDIKYQLAWFDPDKLEKIIYNLLSNAFKYTPDKGNIELNLSVIENYNQIISDSNIASDENLDSKQIVINIEDNGVGIPKENLEKIFDRYYNTKDNARSQEGTGIGLELTRELVELHHGTVTVESKQGKGSCFSVILPLGMGHFKEKEVIADISNFEEKIFHDNKQQKETIVHNEQTEEVLQEENIQENDSSIVLIVEDNQDVRSFIKSNLTEQFTVLEAVNGQEGFNIAVETIPDIIVSDIMMPVMDGLQMCEKIKTDVNTSHIPLILLTAKASEHHKIEGLETGADDYMIKPFNAKELSLKIKNNLESRKKLREKFGNNGKIHIAEVATNTSDEKFLKKATEIVETHMSDINFDNKIFLSEIGMSRTQLYRKLKALTNQSVHEFIRKIRLNKASQLLKEKNLTISEITFEIGFNNHSYFNKCFKEQFGISPSEYMKQNS